MRLLSIFKSVESKEPPPADSSVQQQDLKDQYAGL